MPRHALIHRHHDHDSTDRRDAATGAGTTRDEGRDSASETSEASETTDARRGRASEDTTEDTAARAEDDRRVGRSEHVVPVSPRDTYGGTNWGACFFGWLVALGVTVALAAVAGALAAAVGANLDWTMSDAEGNADAVGLTAAVTSGVIMFVGYYAGGYVAGRMSRFDAARQGLGVWLIGILTAAIAIGVTALLNARYDTFGDVDVPTLGIAQDNLTMAAVVTGLGILVVMLIGAVLGSIVGRRYHRRIDAVIVEH